MVAAAVVGSAVVGAVGAKKSADAQKSAAKKSSAAQVNAADAGIEEQRRQFDEVVKLLSPYVKTGNQATSSLAAFAGLNGNAAQKDAIRGIENSALFQDLTKQGEDAILQNASATGGLRGGNVQGALAQFRPQVLNALISDRIRQLTNLASAGQASAVGQASAGLNTGGNITSLLTQQGQAGAGAALAGGQADQQQIQGLTNSANSLLTLGALKVF